MGIGASSHPGTPTTPRQVVDVPDRHNVFRAQYMWEDALQLPSVLYRNTDEPERFRTKLFQIEVVDGSDPARTPFVCASKVFDLAEVLGVGEALEGKLIQLPVIKAITQDTEKPWEIHLHLRARVALPGGHGAAGARIAGALGGGE